MAVPTPRINLDEPRYDQSTFTGRAKHFLITTNPLNLFASGQQLDEAKELVKLYREGREPESATEDQIWRAKQLYDSAFHPDTGQKMVLIGRMSAQVPMNMSITGCMLTFYRTTPAVIFWQWINQTFNAVVNYTNRSGDQDVPVSKLGWSYLLATSGAVATALAVNSQVHRLPALAARFGPFCAVAAANCINIPFMRSQELTDGIPVFDKDGKRVGNSKLAAKKAVSLVLVSRIGMAIPGMMFTPVIMQRLERTSSLLRRFPMLNPVYQVGLVGFFLVFATPLCCALFPQKTSMAISHLEDNLQKEIKESGSNADYVYFNKGL